MLCCSIWLSRSSDAATSLYFFFFAHTFRTLVYWKKSQVTVVVSNYYYMRLFNFSSVRAIPPSLPFQDHLSHFSLPHQTFTPTHSSSTLPPPSRPGKAYPDAIRPSLQCSLTCVANHLCNCITLVCPHLGLLSVAHEAHLLHFFRICLGWS